MEDNQPVEVSLIKSSIQPVPSLPQIPEGWDYFESVTKIQLLITKWKNLTLEIANELYIARDILSWFGKENEQPRGAGGIFVPPDASWASYCESTGLEKRTANRWLASIFGLVRLPAPPLPKLESQVLYADPPWAFDNAGFDQSAAKIYPVLKPGLIENYTDETGRQIRQLAKQKKSVLFLWVPEAIVPEGLRVLQGWGFIYKAQMVWKKDKSPGMGWWVKSKHEQLFIGARGTELHPATKYDSVFEAPVTKHSKKPEIVYEMIEQMYTGPYIELFARDIREGWISWGNEIN